MEAALLRLLIVFPHLRFASLLAAVLCLAGPSSAQVDGLSARYYRGQTFLTWNELPSSSVRYRVYRSKQPIRVAADLDAATLLGEVDHMTSDNRGRSVASGVQHNWIIEAGGNQLSESTGLFVHTIRERLAILPGDLAQRPFPAYLKSFYAVTTVTNGNEDRTVVPGDNQAVVGFEWAALPEAVLQSTDSFGQLWGHWVGNHDTPFQPALYHSPSEGFNFRYEPGSAPGPRGLVVRLHAAGQHYGNAWPNRFEVAQDVDILAPFDRMQGPGFTLWLGIHDAFPGQMSSAASAVELYTIKRVKWTLDWLTAHLQDEHDFERTYLAGGSMGGMGSFYVASEYPNRFAAVLARNGNFDLRAPDINNAAFVQILLGSYGQNLPVAPGLASSGMGIFDRTDAEALSQVAPNGDAPVFRTLNGKNDMTVGWMSAVTLYDALASRYRPAVHYFDQRRHNPFGFWGNLEQRLLQRTFATRRDRPALHFANLSINDDPGNGNPSNGDPQGTVNGYVDYDPTTASSTADTCTFEVYLRDEGALDDAPTNSATASLTPRRTSPFQLAPGDPVMFTLQEGMSLIATHMLTADADGLVHTPPVPLTKTRRIARFDRLSGAAEEGYRMTSPVVGGPGASGGSRSVPE